MSEATLTAGAMLAPTTPAGMPGAPEEAVKKLAGDILDLEFSEMDVVSIADPQTLDAHLEVYLQLRQKAEELAGILKQIEESEKSAELALLGVMTEQGLESFKAQGFTVTRSERCFPSVLAENRPLQLAWLREIGAGHMIQETVNAQTFAAFVRKDIIEAGGEPPEFVNVYKEPKISLRRAR